MNAHAIEALRAALREQGHRGYIAYTPSSVFYVTGFRSYFISEWWRMHGTVLAFVPADEDLPVTLLVSDFESGTAAGAAPEIALSTYRLWVDLSSAEQMAARPDPMVPLRPEQWDDAELDRRVWEVLGELRMDAGTVATDLQYMNGATAARLRRCAPEASWVDFTEETYAIRLIKQEWEIDRLRSGVELSEAGMTYAAQRLETGMTAQDVRALYQVGVAQATLCEPRYHGYSENWVLPTIGGATSAGYGAVTSGLQRGDLVKFDCGATVGGYRSDGGRTFAFGQASDAARRLYAVVARAQQIACEAIAPGVVIGDVYRLAMDYVHTHGYPTFNRGHIGHSIGIDSFHEEPPYLGPECRQTFQPGMVFAVEVPTYTPDVGAMMVEDLVVVREGGAEILHTLPHELRRRVMDIRDLEVLVALAEELHFGRAAERLRMSQPPLTKRVQKLERSLGVRLFERDRHGVRPTEQGNELIELARTALREVRRLEQHAHGLRSGFTGTITVAAVGSAFYAALPRLLEPCRRRHPQIRFRALELETADIVEALRGGDVDAGFVRPPISRDLQSREVWHEPLVVAVAANHPLARRDQLSTRDLVDQPLVFFDRAAGPGYWDRVAELFSALGAPLEPAVTADHVTTMLGMVALEEGISLVPVSAQSFQIPNVCFVALEPPALLPLSVAVTRGHVRPTVQTFLDTLPHEPLTV